MRCSSAFDDASEPYFCSVGPRSDFSGASEEVGVQDLHSKGITKLRTQRGKQKGLQIEMWMKKKSSQSQQKVLKSNSLRLTMVKATGHFR